MGLLDAGTMAQRLDDPRARLLQRIDMGELMILDLDDVVAELGLDHRHLAGLHPEGRIGKRLHHLGLPEIAKLTSTVFRPGVIGELLGEFGEVTPGLDLFQEIFGLGLGGGLLRGRGVRRHRDQNVTGANLFRMG